MSKALLLDFFIKASEAEEEEARLKEIKAYQEEHAVSAEERGWEGEGGKIERASRCNTLWSRCCGS